MQDDQNARLSDPDTWNARYEQGQTGWDRGGAAPALDALLARIPHAPLRVLVPGAGYGHDAIAWARAGFEVTAVDFAALAVQGLTLRAASAGVALRAVEADVFALPSSFTGAFDLLWEQTCLCAIDPARRGDYVRALHGALTPGGTVYALLWNHQRTGGPPFDLTPALARGLFEPSFAVRESVRLENTGRAGEFLMTCRRL